VIRKRTIAFILILLFVGVTGAFLLLIGGIPIKQLQQQPSTTDFHMVYDDSEKYVLLSIGSEKAKKKYAIIDDGSYAVDQSGKHYPISVKPHDFDLSQGFPYIRDRIYVLRSKVNKKVLALHNGTWTFHLNLDDNGQREQKEFSFRLWTFFYNPVIHGAPN
jgi:hypothetical protein